MKKSSLSTLIAMFEGSLSLEDAKAIVYPELTAEKAKNEAKAAANRELYDEAHDVVMDVLDDTLVSLNDLFAKCSGALPKDFSKSKLSYALANYWRSEVAIDGSGKVNMYRKA